jgi:hypothetical protein
MALANNEMRTLVYEQTQRLISALSMSARREKGAGVGGYVWQLSEQVATLNEWLKSYDSKGCTWESWVEVTRNAGLVWGDWYDWYSRIYTRPIYDDLPGISIDEWREYLECAA